jgi:hypothetical protein
MEITVASAGPKTLRRPFYSIPDRLSQFLVYGSGLSNPEYSRAEH